MKIFLIVAFLMSIFWTKMVFAESINADTIADKIANTQTAQRTDQIILVVDHELTLWNKNADGSWKMALNSYCGYGKNGMSSNRHAGDKTTPIGSFPILYAFGLVDNPGTAMKYLKITPKSYLSGEESTYNTWVESDRPLYDSEHLIDYYQYKYAMNIGFNINPTVYGRGAAIFLHCKSHDRWWTAGCVSVPENIMLDLLKQSHDGTYMMVVPTMNDIVNL